MNIECKRLGNGIMEYLIHNETHTLLRPVTEELRNHPEITFVSYVDVHPLKKQMKLMVRSMNNNETEIIMQVISNLTKTLDEYENEIKEKIPC
jgi:DNA-directed RNA polymerase subunit L